LIPFGKRKVVGYFIEPTETAPAHELKNIVAWQEPYSLFAPPMYKFLKWMSEYYLAGLGDVLHAALPPELRRTRKPSYKITQDLVSSVTDIDFSRRIWKKPLAAGKITDRQAGLVEKEYPGLLEKLLERGIISATFAPPLKNFHKEGIDSIFSYIKERTEIGAISPNDEQKAAVETILANIDSFAPFLLYGITGSGKTLVYCHVVREILRRGKTALILAPEIALAGTVLAYFRGFFGDKVALMHSALKPKERLYIWQEIKSGRYPIVIGARSAIFAPLENLGIIIVDEEHDESYKQDDPSPRFQARDAAVMRAKICGIPIVLGSATPSVESFYNAKIGRYRLLQLTRRPESVALPVVRLVDLKKEKRGGDLPFYTDLLAEKTKESLEKKEQVIFYINRRGFSPRIKCGDCGHTPLCPHCELHLTYHLVGNKLLCHFCGYTDAQYNKCAFCGGTNFVYIGSGSQKIESRLAEIIPEAVPVRLDSDSAVGRAKSHIILRDFAAGKYNLLLGTQMVTKGIDFPNVSLVGVLLADIGIDMPDFRASEKLFAKLIQVAGRSGRGIIPGEVIIQTYNPDSLLIDDAARQDYDSFYAREIASRQRLKYPPFTHLVNFRLSSKKEEELHKYATELKSRLQAGAKKAKQAIEIMGPAPAPLYRLRGVYRRHFFVKTTHITCFVKYLQAWENLEPNFALPKKIKLTIDIDPYDMM
jgi:primosomal protein N' (replication factor Y)